MASTVEISDVEVAVAYNTVAVSAPQTALVAHRAIMEATDLLETVAHVVLGVVTVPVKAAPVQL